MPFDFRRFSASAAAAYREGNPYRLEDCLEVFRTYFQTYEDEMGRPHPPVRREQIARIMEVMPYLWEADKGCACADIEPALYPLLIQLHFKTRYRRCDYNINHFFSGRIRELRLYEADAGYV